MFSVHIHFSVPYEVRSGFSFSWHAKGEHPFWIWGTPSIHIHTEGIEAIDKELIQ